MNYRAYAAGMTPPPKATLTVYNPNASSVAVTGIALTFFDELGNPVNVAGRPPMPAMGPGQTVVVPTLSSITFGPFPIVIGSAANVNTFLAQPSAQPVEDPMPRQVAHRATQLVQIGGVVYGSDGSINTIVMDSVLVSSSTIPPRLFQGGASDFAAANNSCLVGVVC